MSDAPATREPPGTPAVSKLQAPFLAFFSRDLYWAVVNRWRGRSLRYLFLLLFVCWGLIGLKWHREIGRVADEQLLPMARQIPAVNIVGGQVFVEAEQPYLIDDPKTGTPAIIFDTTGDYTTLSGTKAQWLVTDKEVAMRMEPSGPIQKYPFRQDQALEFNAHLAVAMVTGIRDYGALVGGTALFLFEFVFRLGQALLYGFFARWMGRRLGLWLDGPAATRLAAAAISPDIVLGAVMTLGGVVLPFGRLIYLAIGIGYLYYGVIANLPRPPVAPTGNSGPGRQYWR